MPALSPRVSVSTWTGTGVAVDPDDAAPFGVGDPGGLMGLGEQHAMERQGEALAAGLDEQAAQDGQGDRDDDAELGAGAGFGSHLDPAAGRPRRWS